MSVRLLLSSNSVYNTTVSCDSLGIHYDLSKTNGIISVTRWDPTSDSNVLVGQYEFKNFSKSRIKMGGGHDGDSDEVWMNMNDLLFREGSVLSPARYFIGKSGMKYKWTHGWGNFELRRESGLTHDASGETRGEPLVSYHRKWIGKELSYLEVHDQSVMKDLDYIIVTFFIMEKRRRDG